MIGGYRVSISRIDQHRAIKKIDELLGEGKWCRDRPAYQTYDDLWRYGPLKIFASSFLDACEKYSYMDLRRYPYTNLSDHSKINLKGFRMWCYMDHRNNPYVKKDWDYWHHHYVASKGVPWPEGTKGLSGIYYLRNPRNVKTLFRGQESPKPEPFTWFIFPSFLVHRSLPIKSWRKRYTLSADIFYI